MSSVTNNTWKKRQTHRPKVGVVILSYNTADLTRQAVDDVLQSKGVDLEVIVVDNASTDRSSLTLSRKYRLRKDTAYSGKVALIQQTAAEPGRQGVTQDLESIRTIRSTNIEGHSLHLIELNTNLGFGRANNLAAAFLETDFLLFLNSDAFVRPRTILQLTQTFARKPFTKSTTVLSRMTQVIDNVGIAAAQVYNEDKTIQVQGGALPSLPSIFSWIFFLDDIPGLQQIMPTYQHHVSQMRSLKKKKTAKVGWVGGTVMMISRSCWEEIGGFDPHIFMYGEDVELCWRASHRHWDVVLVDTGPLVHLGSASSDHRNAILGEINGLLYLWYKHASPFDLWMLRQILRFGIRLRIVIFGILHRYGRQRTYQEALALV
jgi:GT2 family glycosyltransferase